MFLSSEYLENEDIENGADSTFWSDEIMMYQLQFGLICPGGHWEFFNDVRFQSQAEHISRM